MIRESHHLIQESDDEQKKFEAAVKTAAPSQRAQREL